MRTRNVSGGRLGFSSPMRLSSLTRASKNIFHEFLLPPSKPGESRHFYVTNLTKIGRSVDTLPYTTTYRLTFARYNRTTDPRRRRKLYSRHLTEVTWSERTRTFDEHGNRTGTRSRVTSSGGEGVWKKFGVFRMQIRFEILGVDTWLRT